MNNTSGFEPLDVRVLVKPDSAEKKSAGGIIIPASTQEQEKHAMMKATLVAVGANAWAEAKASSDFIAPAPGGRVLVAKYGGVLIRGDDGEDYRIMNDEDVIGVIREGG